MLRGAAKLFLRSQRGVNSWSLLKKALKNEFGEKLSSADVHRLLRTRRMGNHETLQEYLYALMELGSAIQMDDESIIEYFIDGIPDSKQNKAVLF